MGAKGMRIGEAATKAGVNIRTLHYYDRRGLIKPARALSNYRLYSDDAVQRVRFIKHAQQLGFTLDEIEELLALRINSRATCGDVTIQARAKITDIKEKISALRSMQHSLERLVAACSRRAAAVSECPIIEALDGDTKRSRTR